MPGAQISATFFFTALRFNRIFVNEAHKTGCFVEVRLRPARIGLVGAATGTDSPQIVTAKKTVRIVHEFKVPGITSRDCRFLEQHRLGNGLAEPFGSMK